MLKSIKSLLTTLLLINACKASDPPSIPSADLIDPQNAPKSSRSFWILTMVEQLHMRNTCISAQLCAEPRLTLLTQMPKFSERTSQDWMLAKASVPGIALELFTFWDRGEPSDINLQLLVQGVDPKFKFARVCDESSSVSVYHRIGHVEGNNRDQNDEIGDQIRLELHGQCFNATLIVKLFRHRCPWCPTRSELRETSAQFMSDNGTVLCQFPLRTNFLILLLACATAINVLAFVGLLIICARHRRNGQNSGGEKESGKDCSQNFLANQSPETFTIPRRIPLRHQLPPPIPSMKPPQNNNVLPTIAEEFYEVIDDDNVSDWRPQIPPHYYRKSHLQQSKESIMVQLPLSSKCDHCFLRLRGDNRCSCTSLASSIESNIGHSSAEEDEEQIHAEFPSLNGSATSVGNGGDSGLDGSNHSAE